MRRLLPLVGLLLVVPALSGCLTAQATAMQYRDAAHARAEQWDSQAELAQIVGIEGNWKMDFSWSGSTGWSGWDGSGWSGSQQRTASEHTTKSYWARAEDDDNVGDGRAVVWAYRFVSENKDEVLVVVVDEDGEIVDTDTEAREDDDVPVGEWNVDSDRALQIAKENNEGLREGTDSENFGLVQVLDREPDDDHAKWIVVGAGGDESGGGGGVVIIDAVTGEVRHSSGGSSSG